MSSLVREYKKIEKEVGKLEKSGKESEANKLRDKMDLIWHKLSNNEIKELER